MRLSVLALSSLVSIAAAGGANAQDNRWAGLYGGLNVGYGKGNADFNSFAAPCADVGNCYFNNAANLTRLSSGGTANLSDSKAVGGLQAGYNWQAGTVVFGIEGDIGQMKMSGTSVSTFDSTDGRNRPTVFGSGVGFSTDWLATLRGKIGVSVTPNVLLYGTAGLAFSRATIAQAYSQQTALTGFSNVIGTSVEDTKLGYTLGAGAEVALDRNWSIKAEYLYVNLGSMDASSKLTDSTSTRTPTNFSSTADLTSSVGRVGFNYKF
jgi:outer membrane immunogenic protein